jgi:hypothetical protein
MASMRSMWCGGGLGLILGSSVTLVACGGGLANGQSSVTSGGAAADDEGAADLSEHHRHHHHGGVTMFIAMSLDSLGISPEQQTVVEKVQADLFAKMAPARVAERGVVLAIADGIAAGAVDRGKVDSAIDQVASAAAALHEPWSRRSRRTGMSGSGRTPRRSGRARTPEASTLRSSPGTSA